MRKQTQINDTARQLLQHIADLCNEASGYVSERDTTLDAILSKCDELAGRINEYLD